ncbi:MAG TPA: hypothetical protein VJQ47_13455, partial [Steroidobacteraceae bacterium]|nr:hypothetical protein [Steroidobacteraceae bacterium]
LAGCASCALNDRTTAVPRILNVDMDTPLLMNTFQGSNHGARVSCLALDETGDTLKKAATA